MATAGGTLFKRGEEQKRTYYIVSGTVELLDDGQLVSAITGGSPEARNALAPILPRRYSARARDHVEYIDLLDVMLTWDQTGSYEVSELRGMLTQNDDWMTTLLQTKAFHKIPPANIQAIFMRLKQMNYKAGDVVIKQGDDGDFFYVVTKGRCAVTRETPLNKEGIRLAELKVGDTFGEEALISEAKRNATVTMLNEGSLMRLAKDDFNTLLNEPLLNWVKLDEANEIIHGGANGWMFGCRANSRTTTRMALSTSHCTLSVSSSKRWIVIPSMWCAAIPADAAQQARSFSTNAVSIPSCWMVV